MKTAQNPTCYLIGQDNLVLECAKILHSRSFAIKGIISPANHVKKWAHSQEIDCFHSLGGVDWEGRSADYLFSVVNNEIIPANVLERIRILTINYHDAPLPRYAGSNATSWAIFNNERMHGITWHVVNEHIDGGDILKQIAIPVSADETALSLNMKCFEQAITTFSDLADELVNKAYQRIPQDLSQRTYFARSQKPAGNGWINWHSSAEEIDRLFRATQFGNYRNTFTVLKIVLGDDVFIINELTVLSEQSEVLPGTILEINADAWKIATKTHNLLLSGLSSAQGSPLELNTLEKQYNITIGTELTTPKPDRCFVDEVSPVEDLKQVEATADNLSPEEHQQLLVDWNSTDTPYPAQQTIYGMFEEQVNKTPHHLALIAPDAQLTYQELNNQANQLAHYLITHHAIQPDQLIAVCLERSEWMLIALMGILKSGGAYLPLEPNYPAKRASYMLNDASVRVVLTTGEQAEQLRQLPDIDWQKTTLLVLDHPDFLHKLSQQPTLNPVTVTTSRHLAYVMYTSGTTGIPKGVMVEHQGIVNRITWMNQTYPLLPTDKILQKTPYVFDVSVWELFWANWYGATTVLAKPEGHKEPLYLSQLIQEEQISIIHFTPSMLNGFVQVIESQKIQLSSLRHLFCSGEALNTSIVHKAQTLLPKVEIHNLYGPTEASIDVLFHDCVDQKIVYLGKPIANTRAYVLDAQSRLLSVGSRGELHIAGDGLARGYLNQPALTSQQFIENPFQTVQEKQVSQYNRLYKTGDLARWLPDGNLDYLGRNDTQVKLRGYRIELSEIEYAIHQCPGIHQCIVIVVDNVLVAYYVAEQPGDIEKIQAHVGHYLPEYMVPNQFIFLKDFPLTISGKIDKKKLPLTSPRYSEQVVQPNNKIEEQIAAIFAAVLSLEPTYINITDDFFRLGGDSILAIRLVSRLNKLFQKTLQVKDVLELKTIQALSRLAGDNESNTRQLETPYEPFSLIDRQHYLDAINSNQIEDIYPASYLQIGMLLESSLANNGTYHDVFYYEINQPFEQEKFLNIWQALAHKHALLRARFLFSTQHALDVVVFKQPQLNYHFYSNHSLQELIDAERLNHFLHTEECLFHLIVNSQTDKFELIFSFHHAIVDGWSVASLINEFVQAYAYDQAIFSVKAKQQNLVSLSSNSLSYGEFVRNELHHLNDQTSMTFWKDYLIDFEPAQAKWKFDDTATSPDSLFTSSFFLTQEEAKLVHQLAHEQAISVDTVFLYAYLKTLSFFLNNDDITIGVVFNNRLEKTGGDALFGLFLNVLPFRLQLKKEAGLQEELIETFNTKIKLYEHKHIPYAHLKSEFNRDLYEFGFNFIHFHILKQSEKVITKQGGFDRASIPFLLEVTQWGTFKLELKAHDDYISQEYLDYFRHYLKMTLLNVLQHKNEIALDAHDYQKIVFDWNATFRPFPHEKTLHQLFEEQVLRTPAAIALVYEDKQLTYQELNQQANQLAHYLLQQYQVKPDELIALCLNRNELMVVAILAVLKSGAAYVPIEPDYPDERIFYILQDTKTRVVLTNKVHQQRLSTHTQADTYVVDDESNEIKFRSFFNPVTSVSSSHLAYIIYTSGTTGKPNGVMIGHKGAVNLILEVIKKHNLSLGKHVAFYVNYAFDASVHELFPALSIGCKVFLLANPVRHDLQSLSEYFTTNSIQVSFIPSSLVNDFIQIGKCKELEHIYVNGERLMLDSGINIDQLSYGLIHLYGATEATICTTYKRIKKTKTENPNINIIGRPFASNKCYVLNVNRQLAPVGAAGELFIGGIGLARGYLNNPELTSRKFIQNLFQTDEEKRQGVNEKLYKTGDLARWRPDGDLEYIARNDTQVKIWGYRIEPGEIERVLNTHPEVKQSVVLRGQGGFDASKSSNYLIAYYVKKSSDKEEIKNHNNPTLRAYLEKQLPRYMLPHYFVPLDKLPLTANSKVDHQALPQPVFSSSESYVPPKNQMEQKMCALFAQALGLPQEKIGVTDDFSLQLGGSSIQAIKLMTQINKVFQTDLRLRCMLTHGTVQKLLGIMETNLNRGNNV